MRKEIINQKENLVQNKINFELSMMAVDVVEIMDGLSVTVDLWFHLTQFIFLWNLFDWCEMSLKTCVSFVLNTMLSIRIFVFRKKRKKKQFRFVPLINLSAPIHGWADVTLRTYAQTQTLAQNQWWWWWRWRLYKVKWKKVFLKSNGRQIMNCKKFSRQMD